MGGRLYIAMYKLLYKCIDQLLQLKVAFHFQVEMLSLEI